jgi:hypothetical protein
MRWRAATRLMMVKNADFRDPGIIRDRNVQ